MCGNKQNVAEQWWPALPNDVAEPNCFLQHLYHKDTDIRGTSCSEISSPEFLSCPASQHQLFHPLVEGPEWLLCSLVQPHSSLAGPPVQSAPGHKIKRDGHQLTAGKLNIPSIYNTHD